MRICFPVEENIGLESPLHEHFGSAPLFLVVDTDTRQASLLGHNDHQHQHGDSDSSKAPDGNRFDGVMVGGIGGGVLNDMLRMGLKVFRAEVGTVSHNIDLYLRGLLPELTRQHPGDGLARGY